VEGATQRDLLGMAGARIALGEQQPVLAGAPSSRLPAE